SVIRSINNGVPIATYTGHGNAFQWSPQEIISVDPIAQPPKNDVAALENGPRQPFIIALSCLNNYFVFPGLSSLGEVFVRAEGKGAIAYWGGAGLGFSADHEVVATEFFSALASRKETLLGAIINTAIKPIIEARISEGIVKQLVLLGDPALKLSLPQTTQSSPPPSDGGSPTPNNDSGGGGCFIATAAYGSPLAPQVKLLREFRDRYLVTHGVGRRVVAFYYTFSPPLAEFVSRHEALRAGIQIALLPVLGFSYLMVKTTAWMKFLFMAGSLLMLVWRIRK
ncbi:MAG TPA: CFI-box-CTERM domain-containing protein, partial [Nitrospiria bacterium]|nr:CFI-box-CTERM domain-containing protein [Nitrospiria bacterium]